ncbi:hypothetical protein ABZT43_12240 [Streptomyces sp. NPDC005349]|uniref:hypothetical protein n=1 Tax=Streptomyces sp. NPDC005349 TaxID=3157037 RepID=UPI0033B55D28
MPSLSTLQDNFNDSVIGPNWGDSYGAATETGGRARVACTTGSAGYQTAYSWTMAGASFFVKVVTVPSASTATSAYCGVFMNGDASGTRLGFTIKAVGNLLRMQSDTGFADASAVEIPYDPVAHAFLRLREDGTNVYWDTSPDGATWTNRRTLASPAWIAAAIDICALNLSAHRDAGVGDFAEYDLFNTLDNGAVWTASANLTAVSSLTVAGMVSRRAAVGLRGEGVLAAASTLSTRVAAALTAESTLTADAASSSIPEVAELSAGEWDLYIEQGSTFVQTYTVIDDPAFTWAGWGVRSQIRSAPADNGELLLDLTPYLTVLGAAIRLAIPAAQTQVLTRNGRWDLEVYQGTTVVRLLNGRAIISPEVTRT